ncbi:hypothetical protein YC2023_076067 [Brassica napus]
MADAQRRNPIVFRTYNVPVDTKKSCDPLYIQLVSSATCFINTCDPQKTKSKSSTPPVPQAIKKKEIIISPKPFREENLYS